MQEKELLDHCFQELDEDKHRQKVRRYLWLALGVLLVGGYLFFLLFGSNSWSVLLKLRQQKEKLETQVLQMQDENVKLQKFIFEIKGLEPLSEE